MRQLPPLAAVRAFEAAARHRNYTRAGEELGLTQAGVSYQIKSLEQRVGTVLFVREGRAMRLTPAGEALAQRVSQAFTTMESAFAALAKTEEQVLSIACFQTFATKILAPRLGSFQLEHPEIAVRLVVGDAFVDLEAGECDLAIRLSREEPVGLQVHRLNRLGIAPFASPGFVAAHEILQAEDPDIAEDQRISPNNVWWREWDDARCASHEMTERQPRGLEFDSQQLDAAAAISGNGVAILAPTLFHTELTDGRLVRVGTRIVRPGGYFRLLYPEVRGHSPKVRAFRQWLMREIEPCLAADPGCREDWERASRG
ncbi:LysR substrate-binding domain-containing protein [Alteriqipengyuania lutimaris]|uniref:LysR family transcriptional regulator n=1 Tax=Alteriqipengyuania lutimaris TaxID=1538146 RepID=A0A395LIK8_9SPHN|nr:LysR substrate-binding domain-containing protein [Alteriqipengyuania lutimaris]MBB3034275.1 LysR family glycine cleavage system transcriptional activator [Alteriqipengyuania lutimaris]RDS76816.1 LysR family transcriptional regulator [Alteriqipengyuania lutimaris]